MQSETSYWHKKRILQLELENEELRSLAGERAELVAALASAHDRMMLDLILCGALSSPKKDTTMIEAQSTAIPASAVTEEQLAMSELVASFRQIADYIEQEKAGLDDRRLQNALEQTILGLRQTLDAGRARRFAAGKATAELDEVQAHLTHALLEGKFLTVTPRDYDIESEAMRLMQERGWPETAGIVASTRVERIAGATRAAAGSGTWFAFNVELTLTRVER